METNADSGRAALNSAIIEQWKAAGAMAGVGALAVTVNPWAAHAACWASFSERLAWQALDDGNPGHLAAQCWMKGKACRYCDAPDWRPTCPERRQARQQAWSKARVRGLTVPGWISPALALLDAAMDMLSDLLDLPRPPVEWNSEWQPCAAFNTGASWIVVTANETGLRVAGECASDAPKWQVMRYKGAVKALGYTL